jgi:hypothetical protein
MPDRIRLYLDEDTISRALIRSLRARQVDVLTAQEANLLGVPDDQQLHFATQENRTLFTFNTRDFVQLHQIYLEEDKHHAGIVVSDQLQVGLLTKRLLKLLDAKTTGEMQDWLEFLSNWR